MNSILLMPRLKNITHNLDNIDMEIVTKNHHKKNGKKIKWFGPIGRALDVEQSWIGSCGHFAVFVKCPCGKCSQDWHLKMVA